MASPDENPAIRQRVDALRRLVIGWELKVPTLVGHGRETVLYASAKLAAIAEGVSRAEELLRDLHSDDPQRIEVVSRLSDRLAKLRAQISGAE